MAFDIPLAAEIWTAKYRFAPDAGGGDASVEDSWRRVAEAIAEAEPIEAREAWRGKFLDALGDFQFMPAGRCPSSEVLGQPGCGFSGGLASSGLEI